MDFTVYILLTAILLHILSAIIVGFFVIPLQIREAGVKNGLRKLRVQLLIYGFTIEGLSIVTIIILSSRYFKTLVDAQVLRLLILLLVLLHAIAFFGLAIVGWLIYHQQYSDENKEVHEKIEKITRKEANK